MATESDEATRGPDDEKPVFDELAAQAEERSVRLFDARTTEGTHLALLTGWHKKVLLLGSSAEGIRERLEEHACKVSSVEYVGMEVGSDEITAQGSPSSPRHDRDRDDQAIEAAYVSGLQRLVSDERFDVVVLGDFVRHQAEPRLVLEAVKSVLSPSGSVVTALPNLAFGDVRLALLAGVWPDLDSDKGPALRAELFGRAGIEALFSGAGFRIQEWRGMEQELFSVERGLRRQDFPGQLAEAVSQLGDARVATFVIRAEPMESMALHGEEPGRGSSEKKAPPRVACLAPLWELELRAWSLEKHLQEARDQLEQSSTMLAQLEQSQRRLMESSSHRLARRLERFVEEVAPPRTTRRRALLLVVLAMRHLGRTPGSV